jgi:hypothetical protein
LSSVPKLRLTGGRLAYERAIRYSSLPAPARHLALTIATWADIETGLIPDRFQPSQSTLEEATGLSRGAVFKHSKLLEAEGWLIREAGGGRSNRTKHFLRIPPGAVTSRSGNQSPRDTFPGNRSPGEPETSHVVNENMSPRDTKSPCSTGESPPPSPPRSSAGPTTPGESGREGGRELSPEEQQAADALARITESEPRLMIGELELARLAPLVVPWLSRASQEQLRAALTAGLPPQIGSPVGLLRRRLLEKLPPARAAEPARPGLPRWCRKCGDGNPAAEFNPKFRRAADGSRCPECHPDAVGARAA